ncbi:MAG: hypothetical protein U0L86_01975, partial [Alistipes finegoldii]|nr:hypothetical protein [Alistipes finegoldii]
KGRDDDASPPLPFAAFGAIKDKRNPVWCEGSPCQYLTIKQTGKRLYITRCTPGSPPSEELARQL